MDSQLQRLIDTFPSPGTLLAALPPVFRMWHHALVRRVTSPMTPGQYEHLANTVSMMGFQDPERTFFLSMTFPTGTSDDCALVLGHRDFQRAWNTLGLLTLAPVLDPLTTAWEVLQRGPQEHRPAGEDYWAAFMQTMLRTPADRPAWFYTPGILETKEREMNWARVWQYAKGVREEYGTRATVYVHKVAIATPIGKVWNLGARASAQTSGPGMVLDTVCVGKLLEDNSIQPPR